MGKYNKEQNTIACRKWRQKNKWILKMRARARRKIGAEALIGLFGCRGYNEIRAESAARKKKI